MYYRLLPAPMVERLGRWGLRVKFFEKLLAVSSWLLAKPLIPHIFGLASNFLDLAGSRKVPRFASG